MKLLVSKINYHLELELINVYWKENVKGNAIKVSFKTMKDGRITPR